VKNGVCGVSFDRRDIPMNKFFATCLESVFHVYDARTQNPSKVRQLHLHSSLSWTAQCAPEKTGSPRQEERLTPL
jgi:hypothetical protein